MASIPRAEVDMEFLVNLVKDMANAPFPDEDSCEVKVVRGERLVEFVVYPRNQETCAILIGRGGSMIGPIRAYVRALGTTLGMVFHTVVNEPPDSKKKV